MSMDLSMGQKQLQKLAIDEMAVVLYLRLLFNVLLCLMAALGLTFLTQWVLGLKADTTDILFVSTMVLLYMSWAIWTLRKIRVELRGDLVTRSGTHRLFVHGPAGPMS